MIGAFFLLNVILAVIVQAIDSIDEVKDKAQAKHDRFIKQSLDRRKYQDMKKGIIKTETSSVLSKIEIQPQDHIELMKKSSSHPTPEMNKEQRMQSELSGNNIVDM